LSLAGPEFCYNMYRMKTVLITGAYRGLGLETARQLAARGFKVIVTARELEKASAAAAGLPNARALQLDLNDEASVARAAAAVPELDVLINNAAILEAGDEDVLRIPLEIVERTLINNTVGALRVAQAFVPYLLRSKAGRIVNVSSGGGQLGGGETSTWAPAYCISKTALNSLTCQLAAALKSQGIAVNSVCPGWCRTDMGGAGATRSVEEGAAGIAWLAADAPQDKTGLFWRDREVIPW
jgi:NAD(P)-dependent dehydrogenase (short-subunit alcohol dehydrogenase family)